MVRNPEAIATKADVEDIIADLEAFERVHGKPAGIAKKQSSSASSYEIVAVESVRGRLGAQGETETIMLFLPKQHFYDLMRQYE